MDFSIDDVLAIPATLISAPFAESSKVEEQAT
jgi:hypothetical protein